MQVLLDLRPPHLVHLQERSVDALRLLSIVLFMVFMALSFWNVGFTAFKYLQVRQELSDLLGRQSEIRTQSASLAETIKQMQALKTQIAAYLEFTREELPAVEFLKTLEDTVPDGLKISSLNLIPGNASMTGSALGDDRIIAFAANLDSQKYIVTRVNSPVTTKSVLGSRQISDFRITCDIRKVLDIAANDPNRQAAIPSAVGEGGGIQ
jgi:Tfp pilus assembly protein PilN